jgi:hypothetical protein
MRADECLCLPHFADLTAMPALEGEAVMQTALSK